MKGKRNDAKQATSASALESGSVSQVFGYEKEVAAMFKAGEHALNDAVNERIQNDKRMYASVGVMTDDDGKPVTPNERGEPHGEK